MQGFRNFLRGTGGKILLAAIILPFIISAFYGYFTGGGGGDVVARVEGNDIYRAVVDDRVQRTRLALRQQSPELDPQLLDNFINPGMVLQGMVNNVLVLTAASDAGMVISDEQAGRTILQIPEFHDQNGRFSQQQFDRTVRTMGQTPSGYMSLLRDEMLMNQFRAGYEDTAFGLPYELEDLRRLGEQRRDISYIRISAESLVPEFDISDEQVEAFYHSTPEDFIRPPEYQLEYIDLSRSAYLDDVQLTEEQLREEYEVREQMFRNVAEQQERRRVSHILLTGGGDDMLARAEALREQIVGGAEFAELAREHSDDAASASLGGVLGVVGRGDLPASLDQVAFTLEEGEVSQPIATDDGVHLLVVTSINRRTLPEFDALRDEIEEELKVARAEMHLSEDVRQLEELAFEHADLSVPAETLGASLQRTPFFPLGQPVDIAAEPAVRRALSDRAVLEGERNSPLIELGQGRYAVVRVADSRPEEEIPLAEVREDIARHLALVAAQARLDELAAEGGAALEEGADLARLAGLWRQEVISAENLERGGSQPETELVERVFRLPRPAADGQPAVQIVRMGNGDLAAISLDSVRDGNPQGLTGAQQAAALGQLGELAGAANFRQVVTLLREEGDVRIYNERLMDEIED